MRLLIIGSLNGPLGQAARLAMSRGAAIEHAGTAEDALPRLRVAPVIEAVFCDLSQDITGLLLALAGERITVPVIACGTEAHGLAAAAAIRAGAREFLPLPPDAELIAAILAGITRDEAEVIARDPFMLATLRRAEQVAASEASILITGPSGTGKEVLARHIHRRSRRAGGPFIAMNCAAIPEALLESELFGHEKGAFSGATARRIGRFEAADGGTLLLDEISEMDIRLQAKLLRVIQEREVDRLGGTRPVRINVRILATSNRDLPAETRAGRFREDLYFRLNVVNLRVPPLRERPQDIAALAEHFAQRYANLNGLPPRRLSAESQACLRGHAWPGNVRELENVVHRAVLLASGEEIEAAAIELPAAGLEDQPRAPHGPGAEAGPPVGPSTGLPAGLVGRRMEEVERDLILATLSHTLGNRTHAATILGISIRALRNKLRDYTAQGAAVPPPGAGVGAAA
ncbi:MAG: sigma-54-dependent Fis family transcriptional regulator [Rhodospirillales bacterium]|nr:sigma-54-dependent Fis family transcriptional regulator [Rhodospirillales bacterium]